MSQGPQSIEIRCPCGEVYHATSAQAGKTIRCRACGRLVTISLAVTGRHATTSQAARPHRPKWLAWVLLAFPAALVAVLDVQGQNGGVQPASTPLYSPPASTLEPPIVPEPSVQSALPHDSTPSCGFEPAFRPSSGTPLVTRSTQGLGILTIENGTTADAYALLVSSSSGRRYAAMYLRAGTTAAIRRVAPDTYDLRFQFWDSWLRINRFCTSRGSSQFDRPLIFEEIPDANGTLFSQFRVTLHPVPGGDARTHAIPDSLLGLTP